MPSQTQFRIFLVDNDPIVVRVLIYRQRPHHAVRGGACRDFSCASTGPIDAKISAASTLVRTIPDELLATAQRALDSVKSAGGRQTRLDHIADSQALKRHARRACVLTVGQST